MVKRSLAVVLSAVVLTTGFLSGCKASKTGTKGDDEFTIYGGDLFTPDENGDVYKALNEKLGGHLKFIESTWDSRHDKLNMLISSGDTPDMFSYGYTNGENVQKLVKQDLITELTPYADKYPNIKERLEKYSIVKNANNGYYYNIPTTSDYGDYEVTVPHAWFYRKDIVEKLGLKLPTNADEMYEFLKAISQSDVDGNGQNDTFGMTVETDYFLYPLYNLFGGDMYRYEKVGNEYKPLVISDKMKQGVAYIKRLYDEKILDNEFMLTPSQDVMLEKFISGKAGVIFTNYKYNNIAEKFQKAYPDKNPRDLVAYMPMLYNSDGEQKVSGNYNFFGALYIKKQPNEERTNKILKFIDYLMSDDGMTLLRYGVEGKDYKKENGKIVSTLGKDENGNPVKIEDVDKAALVKQFVSYDVMYMDDTTPNRDYLEYIVSENHKTGIPNPFAYAFIDPNKMDPTEVTALEEYTQKTITKLIVESKDLDKDWDSYVNEYMAKGGSKLIPIMNEQAPSLLK